MTWAPAGKPVPGQDPIATGSGAFAASIISLQAAPIFDAASLHPLTESKGTTV